MSSGSIDITSGSAPRFDSEILDLIPHRPPMLLINKVLSVDQDSSKSMVTIDSQTLFFETDRGVPSWIGLEYMGQTAALIAGYQLRQGLTKPHLGLLLGSRQYSAVNSYFCPNKDLIVQCSQAAMVGESLVTFNCTIREYESDVTLAEANLSVFRKPK